MKKKSKNLVAGLILAASLLFSSCGGGISGGGNNPTPVDPGDDPSDPIILDPDKPEDVPEPEDILERSVWCSNRKMDLLHCW